jgi:hypothetical protein
VPTIGLRIPGPDNGRVGADGGQYAYRVQNCYEFRDPSAGRSSKNDTNDARSVAIAALRSPTRRTVAADDHPVATA